MKKYIYILALFFLGACSHFSEEAVRYLVKAEMLMETQPDSAMQVLRAIPEPAKLAKEQLARYALLYTMLQDRLFEPLTSDSLINIAINFYGANAERYHVESLKARYCLGRVCEEMHKEEEAMDIYVRLEPELETLSNYNLLGLLNSRMAILFRFQNLIEHSVYHNHKSVHYFKQAKDIRREGYILSNIGYDYLYLKQYDSTVVYCQEARTIAKQINDTLLLSQSLMHLGMAYNFLDKPEAVKLYLLEAANYEKKERKLVQVYNYLAGAYLQTHQYEMATFYAKQALEISEKNNYAYGMGTAYWYLYSLAMEERSLTSALDYYQSYSRYKDSVSVQEARNNIFAVQEKYRVEELRAENMRLRADREGERWVQTMAVALIAILFMFVMLIKAWQEQKLLKQKELLRQKESRLKEFLLKRLDVSKEIVTIMQTPLGDPEKLQAKLKSLIDSLSFNLSDQEELIIAVNELFNGFADKLKAAYPQLTADELQLCCMIRSGFDSGLISTALGVNFETIYKKRSRLRKKIGLDRDEDFESFLQKF